MTDKKTVVSVSLGSSTRNATIEAELLGNKIAIERRGTDGDLTRAEAEIRQLDGKVDAIGLGGTDLFVTAGKRRYYIRDSVRLARNAQSTPVVCGAGLKNTLERRVVKQLDPAMLWRNKKVLMLSGTDRYGMAEALTQAGADIVFGDLIFILGLPVALKSLGALRTMASLLGPVVTNLPISWLYPTGKRQETSVIGWRTRYFDQAEVIAGDFLLLKRYAPEDLSGKIVLTNTTTADDVAMLRQRGVSKLITTTPRYNGRSLATNLLEATFLAISGKTELSDEEYLDLLEQSGLGPDVLDLTT